MKLKLPFGAQISLTIIGLLITIGVYICEVRNSQLCNDLISRGKKIEELLKIDTGQFLGLGGSRKFLGIIPLNHSFALRLIYLTTIISWALSILLSILFELDIVSI